MTSQQSPAQLKPGYVKRRNAAGPGIGIASVIMIFSVLCLTIFAALALVTANSELELARAYARSVSDYYTADNICSEFVSALRGCKTEEQAKTLAEKSGALLTTAPDNSSLIEFSAAVGNAKTLKIILTMTVASDGIPIITVDKWTTAYSGDWAADNSLELWIPE